MKKIKLKSTYPCLVKTEKESLEIDENDVLEIENEERIFIYPTLYSRKNIPFYINLQVPKSCHRYFVHEFDDFALVVLTYNDELKILYKENFPTLSCSVTVSQNAIKFEKEEISVEYTLPHNFFNYHIFKLDNYACVEFDDENLYLFNTKTNVLSHFSGNMDLDKNVLTVKKNLHDLENRVKKSTFKLEDDKIKLESLDFSHDENKYSEDMTPYRFLEAVKIKDFDFALNLLEKKNVSKENLETLFGNVKSYLPLSTNEFVVLGENEKRFVRFFEKCGKIVDISVDKL